MSRIWGLVRYEGCWRSKRLVAQREVAAMVRECADLGVGDGDFVEIITISTPQQPLTRLSVKKSSDAVFIPLL